MKNEAEAYMLKELSLMKWQEKAAKLAHEDTNTKMVELQDKVSSLEENMKTERYFLPWKVISWFEIYFTL